MQRKKFYFKKEDLVSRRIGLVLSQTIGFWFQGKQMGLNLALHTK